MLRILRLFFLGLASAQPINVRTEYARCPILIDNPFPRFSWQLNGSAPQLAFRVFVSPSPSLYPLAWDSGVVVGNTSSQVSYAGAPLQSDTTYYVIVSSQTAAGWANASASNFGVGLLTPAAWAGAAWIGGFNQLRGTFSLRAGVLVSRARAYVTGVGCAELWVNGARVSNDTQGRETFFNPGFSTIYSTRLLYNAFDVSALLLPGGKNVVGLRLGQCKYGCVC
jgi:alpha-L-rhamnosidase